MQYAIAVAALVAGVSATYPVASYPASNETVPAVTPTGGAVYTTEVVTAYTTYCPAPTTITHGSNTYTVTEATTLTITDCPCTISKPIYSSAPAPPNTYVPGSPSAPAPYPTGNATAPGAPSGAAPVGTAPGSGATPGPNTPPTEGGEEPSPSTPAGEPTESAPATGAASRAFAPAGLAGLLGLAAYLL